MSSEDAARAIVKTTAAAAAVANPILGPLGVVIDEVWMPRWARQGREFVQQLAEDVEAIAAELYESVDELRDALDRSEVAEVFIRAGEIARVSSDTATRRRCRAAVLNTMRQPQNAAYNLRFLRIIDELAPAHFALLSFLQDPQANDAFVAKVQNIMGGGMLKPTAEALGYDEGFVRMLSHDLETRGLGGVPDGMMTGNGLLQKRTTSLGDRLLEFVRHPVAGDAE